MERLRTVLFLGLALMLSWGRVLVAQSPDSAQSDIDMVRATYAKLTFAVRLYGLREKYTSGANLGTLGITLSEIKAGPVSEVRQDLLSELVTKPSGRTLAVTPVTWKYKTSAGDELAGEGASVHWTDSPYLSEDWNRSLGSLFAIGVIDPGYTRYASVTVKASYAGEQRQYQSLFLFGRDASGHSITLPIDQIIGASALLSIIQAPSTPDPLLAARFRTRSGAKAFLHSLRAPAGCSAESRSQMCCDEVSGKCGVSADVLQAHGFAASETLTSTTETDDVEDCGPICSVYNTTGTPDVKNDSLETQDHYSGYHTATATFISSCTYSGTSLPCSPLCSVNVSSAGATETGITYVYCHRVPSNQTSLDGEGSNTCSASWGYGVGGCFACIPCSVSVSVGAAGSGGTAGVTVSGGNATLWTWGVGLVSGPCPTIKSNN